MEKYVFITGATSGFGEACAEIFAKNDVIFIIDSLLLNILKHQDLNIIYKKIIKIYNNKNNSYLY